MASSSDHHFRSIIRDRLLVEMLRGCRGKDPASDWKVLIMDDYTIKVMSTTCKMADITDEGISLVESLSKYREPLPAMDAVYFVQPSKASVKRLVEDMGGQKALYRKAHVFFSSPVNPDILQVIKDNAAMRGRIAALREMNLEISTVDRQGFVTDQERALVDLFGSENDHYERCISVMAQRLATVFASLKEFPTVRYRAAKTSHSQAGTPERARDLVPTKLAAAVWDQLLKYKKNLPGFPHHDTCDLLILDRSVDPITPLIHDWSYGGMAFDLLPMDGNKYDLKIASDSGKDEVKTVVLEEHDAVWMEIRDLFIGEALQKVVNQSSEIASKSLAQKTDVSAKEMQAIIAGMSKYRDLKDKVDLHVNMAGSLMKVVERQQLMAVGKLEQGFVFGEPSATYKELGQRLKGGDDEISHETKQRLLAVYAATNTDKYNARRQVWKQMSGLTSREMLAVNNLEFLGIGAAKAEEAPVKSSALSFGKKSAGKGASSRKDNNPHANNWELMRYYPLLQDLLEDLDKSTLSTDTYPYVQEPSSKSSLSGSAALSDNPRAVSKGSVRSVRGGSASSSGSASSGASWAKSAPVVMDSSSPSVSARKGRRIFVFMVGGMMRAELRVAHLLSQDLNREIILGSSSLETPTRFLENVRQLLVED
eukprot:TRINITY_DN2487_c1_g3_i1.p1 TRINITY_DN2487_c1_g3~~TRINITY_DN2487_c1_g3_i1.p1  ORF type:complete len:651 (+),score=183.48 TRINITY_DN2487_c1_g3_i1:829-2781(+)